MKVRRSHLPQSVPAEMGQHQTDRRVTVLGRVISPPLPADVVASIFPLWFIDAVSGGGVHAINLAVGLGT